VRTHRGIPSSPDKRSVFSKRGLEVRKGGGAAERTGSKGDYRRGGKGRRQDFQQKKKQNPRWRGAAKGGEKWERGCEKQPKREGSGRPHKLREEPEERLGKKKGLPRRTSSEKDIWEKGEPARKKCQDKTGVGGKNGETTAQKQLKRRAENKIGQRSWLGSW